MGRLRELSATLGYFTAVVLPLVILLFLIGKIYQKSLYSPLLVEFKEGKELSLSDYEKLYEVFGPEVRDDEGNTLLHRLVVEACREREVPELLRELLKEGLSPDEKNSSGQTAVHLAVKFCQDGEVLRELLKVLTEFKADLNAGDCAGNTPLFYAVVAPYDNLKTLLEFKPEVNAKNFYGWTPLCRAALWDLLEQFTLLEKAGGRIEERCGKVPVPELARALRSSEVADYLKKRKIELKEVKENLKELLFTPSANKKCVKEYFEREIERALSYALLLDQVERVKAFYGAGLFPKDGKIEGMPVALFAVKNSPNCSPKVLEFLLSEGLLKPSDRFEGGETLLHICAERGCDRCVKVLVKWGADPNAKDDKGFTPYCRAVAKGKEKTARELLRLGADPNAPCVKAARELKRVKPWIEELSATPSR